MPTEKDQKTVLLDKLTEQRQAIFYQLRHLAETMPEILELKKARADLVEFEKLEQQISDYDVTEKYKPTSITEARKLLLEVCEYLEIDKLIIQDTVCLIGMLYYLRGEFISNSDKNIYTNFGLKTIKNIEEIRQKEIKKRRQIYADENELKNHILETWANKGLSVISETVIHT